MVSHSRSPGKPATTKPEEPKAKLDEEDVVQSVLRSFFTRQAKGTIAPRDRDHLWALLAMITARKCARQRRHFEAGRRDVRLEIPLAKPGDSDLLSSWASILAHEPSAEEAAILEEEVEQLLNHFGQSHRVIAQQLLEGSDVAEIKSRLSCSERTIYRVLQRLREYLELQS
ncbi:MAG: ECF-type sigma factor [Planctomycetaceae bacterium]